MVRRLANGVLEPRAERPVEADERPVRVRVWWLGRLNVGRLMVGPLDRGTLRWDRFALVLLDRVEPALDRNEPECERIELEWLGARGLELLVLKPWELVRLGDRELDRMAEEPRDEEWEPRDDDADERDRDDPPRDPSRGDLAASVPTVIAVTSANTARPTRTRRPPPIEPGWRIRADMAFPPT